MRRHYLDNIRWMTVVLVVIYHVVYMFNGVQPFGVIGLCDNPSFRYYYEKIFVSIIRFFF